MAPRPKDSHGMNPPTMRRWNLALRFGLELCALVGLGVGGWSVATGAPALVAGAAAMMGATAWGVFNVPDDPSRSGRAPVRVTGRVRLAVEALILGSGAGGLVAAGLSAFAIIVVGLALIHYAVSWRRIEWLLAAPTRPD